jgi:TPR repeat protein
MKLTSRLWFIVALLSIPSFGQNISAKDIYQRGLNAFAGGPLSRSDFRGLDDIRKAADLGYAPAQFAMGYMLETGAYTVSNVSDSVIWYRKAAEQGDRLAQWNLGRCYYTGSGVSTDLDQAELWLKQSAEQGDPFGQYLLGRVKQDRSSYEQAARLFDESAHQGLPQAQVRLARMLKDGRAPGGVNKYGAYVWFLAAQAAGDNTVANDVSELEGQLGSTLIEKAKTEAHDLSLQTARAAIARGCTGWQGELDVVPQPPPLALQQFCR